MPTKKRVFWNVEEQRSVLTTARQLRQNESGLTLKQIGTTAQRALPKQRRRPVNNKLTSWLSTGLKSGAPPNATSGSKTVKRMPRAKVATAASAAQSSLVQTLIEHGAAILSGILRHPSVRDAFAGTVDRRHARRKT
jgi:hypothetical protein